MHIRDIIQKSMIMLVALVGLFAITMAVKQGIADANPGGVQLFKTSRDLFYIDELTTENENKIQLIEDIDLGNDTFMQPDERIHPDFKSMGENRENRMMGESSGLMEKENPLRSKKERFLDSDGANKENILPLIDRPDTNTDLPQIGDPNNEALINNKENTTEANRETNNEMKRRPDGNTIKSTNGNEFLEPSEGLNLKNNNKSNTQKGSESSSATRSEPNNKSAVNTVDKKQSKMEFLE